MITVVGSINLDIVATGPKLPRPGRARTRRWPRGGLAQMFASWGRLALTRWPRRR